MTDPTLFNDVQDYSEEAKKLQRRRLIAEQLIAKNPAEAGGTKHGSFYAPNFGTMATSFADKLSGNRELERVDAAESALSASQQRATQQFMDQQPEAVQRLAPGLQIPGLRQTIAAQIGDEYEAPAKQAELQAKRQWDAEQKELDRIEKGEQMAADRVAREDLRAMPTQHITIRSGGGGGGQGQSKPPSGYRWGDDGNLAPIPGGPADKQPGTKALTAKQLETQRGFMDLDSSIANYEQLLNGYDFQGKSAASPKQRAALEGAYTDLQMKLKTLYELGAPQAGDLKLLAQSIPNPVDLGGTVKGAAFGADPFKARLNETKKLLNSSRQNFETQMGKPTPTAAAAPTTAPTVIREVKLKDGRTGVEYSDGSRGYK